MSEKVVRVEKVEFVPLIPVRRVEKVESPYRTQPSTLTSTPTSFQGFQPS
jgi:hypothetical protein